MSESRNVITFKKGEENAIHSCKNKKVMTAFNTKVKLTQMFIFLKIRSYEFLRIIIAFFIICKTYSSVDVFIFSSFCSH